MDGDDVASKAAEEEPPPPARPPCRQPFFARARGDWRSSLGCDAVSHNFGAHFRPARENDSLCLANLVGHWWFGSQRHARPGSPMSSKVDMINALGQAEVARKKAQRSAYVPDLFLLERLNFFTQIPKQCPQSQACFGSFLARQLDSGVSSLGAKLPKLEEYWLKAAAVLELEKGLTAAPLYFTRILRDVLPLLGPDLRAHRSKRTKRTKGTRRGPTRARRRLRCLRC